MPRDRTLRVQGDEFIKPLLRVEDFERLHLVRPITLLNGCFDLLHSGHMYLLHQARNHNLYGTIVVALDSDEMIRSYKPGRPIIPFLGRWNAISYTPIDIVVEITDNKDFQKLVKILDPDIRVRGIEYKKKNKPSRISDIPTIYVPLVNTQSTSRIIIEVKKYLVSRGGGQN